MRKLFALTSIAIVMLALAGCGGKIYRGKYVTATVQLDPIDEFQHGKWVVLAFETPGKRPEEGEYNRFWLYVDGEKKRELVLVAKVVGKRMFYLQEQVGKQIISHASFVAPPTYDAVKERIKALLSSEEPK